MTLFDILQKQSAIYVNRALCHLSTSDKEFYKSIGHIDMCNKLHDLLSDETLKMEVKTRGEVLKEGD